MRMGRLTRCTLAFALAGLVSACKADSGAPIEVGEPVTGGTAIVAVTSDFQAFNPVTNSALVLPYLAFAACCGVVVLYATRIPRGTS